MKNSILPLLALLFLFANSCQKNDTCNNGILDGDEEQIDCGGSSCDPCCLATGGTFNGNADLYSQAQIDSFGEYRYEEITGTVNLGGNTVLSLSPLCSITKINNLFISSTGITDLDGLQNLTEVHTLNLVNLDNITNVNELSNLQFLDGGELYIGNSQNITNLYGLNVANTNFSHLVIIDNPSMTNIDALNDANVTDLLSINDVTFTNSNMPLINVANGSSVYFNNNVGDFDFPTMLNMDSIGLLEIISNANLTNLDFVQNIEYIFLLDFFNNSALVDVCGLTQVVQNGHITLNGTENNGYNPTNQDVIMGDCEL